MNPERERNDIISMLYGQWREVEIEVLDPHSEIEKETVIRTINVPEDATVQDIIELLSGQWRDGKVKIPGPLGMSTPLRKLQIEVERTPPVG